MDKQSHDDRERRFHTGGVEYRAAGDDKPATIRGLAAVFNKRSENLGGFVEVIAPGAFDEVLEDDVRGLFNHDGNILLSRLAVPLGTNGGLALRQTSEGLEYEMSPLDTQTVRDLVIEPIKAGLLDQSSFQFRIAPGGAVWDEDDDGVLVRTVQKIGRLYDVSPVTLPAYTDTKVAVRSMEAWRKGETGDPKDPVAEAVKELRSLVAALEEQNGRLTKVLAYQDRIDRI